MFYRRFGSHHSVNFLEVRRMMVLQTFLICPWSIMIAMKPKYNRKKSKNVISVLVILLSVGLFMAFMGCSTTKTEVENAAQTTETNEISQRKALPLCETWPSKERDCYLSHDLVLKLIAEGKADMPNQRGETPIMVAADIESVKALIDAGVNLNPELYDQNGAEFSLITIAIAVTREMNYDDGRVELLLEAGAKFTEANLNPTKNGRLDGHNTNYMLLGTTDLMRAWTLNQVKALVERGANVNAQHVFGVTPLLITMLSGYKESKQMTKYLIEHGADVNVVSDGMTPLSIAPDGETVDLLISKGADVNLITKHGWKFKNVNADKMQALLKAGFNIHMEYYDDITPLMLAEDVETAKLLIHAGYDINAKTSGGRNALMLAFNADRYDVVKFLIESGSALDADNNGSTLLMREPSIEIAKILVAKGIDVNAKTKDGLTALDMTQNTEFATFLIESGAVIEKDKAYGDLWVYADAKLASMLIERGVDVNRYDDNSLFFNKPPLLLTRDPEVVELLINAGADVNISTKYGLTPLMREIVDADIDRRLTKMGYSWQTLREMKENSEEQYQQLFKEAQTQLIADNRKIIQLLLAKGANVNASTKRGQTALSCTSDPETIKILLDAGADPNGALQTSEHIQYLPIIKSATNAEALKLLLAAGADPKAETELANTALLEVFINKQLSIDEKRELAKLLIEAGADINYKTQNASGDGGSYPYPHIERPGTSILLALIDSCHYTDAHSKALESIKLALELGADVNTSNIEGKTALMSAIDTRSSLLEIAQILLEHGANINVNAKYTPLIISASRRMSTESIKLLLAAGADPNAESSSEWESTPLAAVFLNFSSNLSKQREIAELLISAGAHINHELYVSPHTVLSELVARTSHYKEVSEADFDRIKLVVELGADVNVEMTDGHRDVLAFIAQQRELKQK